MVIRTRVIAADDKEIAPGALPLASNIPVTVGFDGHNVVGKATVFADGSAELVIDAPMQRKTNGVSDGAGVLGLGFVVEAYRFEGDVRIIEKLRPVTVGVSAELVELARRGGREA